MGHTKSLQRCLLAAAVAISATNYALIHFSDSNVQGPGKLHRLMVGTKLDKTIKRFGIASKKFRSHVHNLHNVSEGCHNLASNAVLDQWKSDSRIVCSTNSSSVSNDGILVEEFVLRSWEYEPTLVRYRNVQGYWGGGIQPIACPNAQLRYEKNGKISMQPASWSVENVSIAERNSNMNLVEIKDTVIQVQLFDQDNPYQRFHPYLNAAMTMRLFNIENPQIVLKPVKKTMPESDIEMWRSFSTLEPIVLDTSEASIPMQGELLKRFSDLIHLSSSGTSMLTTKTSSVLLGKLRDHHCKSLLFRDTTYWMALNFGIEMDVQLHDKIQILFSSRRPYCCRDNKMWPVKRMLKDEDRFIERLKHDLGPNYNINIVDFATKSSRESIEMASKSDIIIGIHGAGLIWAGFLPHHGGLIEIFGGNRARSNRQYHNLASLADLHYRELSLFSHDPLQWNDDTMKEMVALIRSIDVKQSHVEPDENAIHSNKTRRYSMTVAPIKRPAEYFQGWKII